MDGIASKIATDARGGGLSPVKIGTEHLNSTAPTKFPPIEGLSIDDAHTILRTANRGSGIGIEEVIQIMDCDAHRADKVLRAMAMAGYLNPSIEPGQVFWWERTLLGNRLALEKKRKRFGRAKVDMTIAELVERAKLINSNPTRLQRITLRLFGSALEDRVDYGDVDVAIKYHQRQLPEKIHSQIVAALEGRQSDHERQTILGRLSGAEIQDTREIRALLTKGLPHVALMSDDPMTLGTPFRWLVNHDLVADTPAEVSADIIRPNVPSQLEQEISIPFPAETLVKARQRELTPTSKVSIKGLSIGVEDAAKLEEALWTPKTSRKGILEPNDLRDDAHVKFAGFQHLSSVWKEPIGGVEMLQQALEWCEEHKVWVRDLFPRVSILRSDRAHVIRLGLVGELIYFKIGANAIQGSLLPINRTRVSQIDLAGAYAVARALANMYREAKCSKMQPFSAELFIPWVTRDRLPDFPKMVKAGEFQKDALKGLVDVRLFAPR